MTEPQPLPEAEFRDIYRRVPRLTVEVVIADSRGLLLTRRDIEPCRGLWHLPGGTVLFGERLAGAVVRVARRELGVEVSDSIQLGCIEYPSHFEHGLDHPVGIAFRVTGYSGDLRISSEASAHGWFRRLPAAMHEDQIQFLVAAGLADPPATGEPPAVE